MAKIKFISQGPSGKVQYIEGSFLKKNTCEFYFELGGRDTVATVWVPANDAEWDKQYPWAAGRRKEILDDLAAQVHKEQAPSSIIRWEKDRFHLMTK